MLISKILIVNCEIFELVIGFRRLYLLRNLEHVGAGDNQVEQINALREHPETMQKDLLWINIFNIAVIATNIVYGGILDSFSWARSDKLEVNIPWLPFENESRCYDELGCLNITRRWYHLINRPFNVFPLPRSVINTRFILYTKLNPTEGQLLRAQDEKTIKKSKFDPKKTLFQGQLLRAQDEKTIKKSKFDPKKKTKFIIHGFIDTPLSNWVGDMRDELLKVEDMNVIVVDWAGGSLPLTRRLRLIQDWLD
ncbi:Lipase [Popillia japonica]|uniref:Lipase n=1 Tax=Popillia japonica TaxID=7064 RepID=A0AAW1J0N4_POPJA